MKRLSLVLLVMVMVALVTSCATAATNVWLGDQVKTNSVKSTNYVQLMVQRPGTAGTGSNGLWRLIKAEDFISSLSLPQKNAVNTWTTSNIFNQHIWLADGKRLFVNGASLALDDGTGDTILNTFDDIRFQQSGVDKLVLSNGVLYGDGAGLTNVPGTGGGNTFTTTQFATNGSGAVVIKSGALTTNQSLLNPALSFYDGVGYGTVIEPLNNGVWAYNDVNNLWKFDTTNFTFFQKVNFNTNLNADRINITNDLTIVSASGKKIRFDGTGQFDFWRLGDGNNSVMRFDWIQGGLNGAWEWWDRPYSNSNKIMSLDVTAGTSSALRFYAQGGWTDSSNYKLGQIQQNANSLDIGTYALGTGASTSNSMALTLSTWGTNRWTVTPTGNLIATTDGVYEIGASGANRPLNIYASSIISAGTAYTVGGNASIRGPANGRAYIYSTSAQGELMLGLGTSPGTNAAVLLESTAGGALNIKNQADTIIAAAFSANEKTNWLGGTTTITNLDLKAISGVAPKSITNTWYSVTADGTGRITNETVYIQGVLTSWKQNGTEL